MSFSKIALLALLLPLAACATQIDPKTLTEATVPSYTPVRTDSKDEATIKGTYIESTGLLGTPSSLTYLVAIDGRYYDAEEAEDVPNPVPTGQHIVTLAFKTGNRSVQVPAFVDFKPGGHYVIKREYGDISLNSFNHSIPPDTLWIEDEKTGEIVAPKLSVTVYDSKDRYVPPAGATSTISGTSKGDLLDKTNAFVQMVDGHIVDGDGAATILENESGRPDYAVPLNPGRHGIAIRLESNLSYGVFPVMFDVKPNTSYVVKFDDPKNKIYRDHLVIVTTFWIEETATGVIALPKIDMPTYHGTHYTPDPLAQPAAPTATPK